MRYFWIWTLIYWWNSYSFLCIYSISSSFFISLKIHWWFNVIWYHPSKSWKRHPPHTNTYIHTHTHTHTHIYIYIERERGEREYYWKFQNSNNESKTDLVQNFASTLLRRLEKLNVSVSNYFFQILIYFRMHLQNNSNMGHKAATLSH